MTSFCSHTNECVIQSKTCCCLWFETILLWIWSESNTSNWRLSDWYGSVWSGHTTVLFCITSNFYALPVAKSYTYIRIGLDIVQSNNMCQKNGLSREKCNLTMRSIGFVRLSSTFSLFIQLPNVIEYLFKIEPEWDILLDIWSVRLLSAVVDNVIVVTSEHHQKAPVCLLLQISTCGGGLKSNRFFPFRHCRTKFRMLRHGI